MTMNFTVYHQEDYSRGELLLRTFFGFFYIVLPHAFILAFLALWSAILQFISFWVILFTGRYPENFFEYQVKYLRWSWRVNARILNLSDGYPAFGLDVEDESVEFDIPYKGDSDRMTVLLRGLFGFIFVYIPHGFCLFFLGIVANILVFVSWWVVLFTGKYPSDLFKFTLQVQQWSMRVTAYMMYLTDVYPPFSLEPDMTPYEEEAQGYVSRNETGILDDGYLRRNASPDVGDDEGADESNQDDEEPRQPNRDDLV